MTVDVVVDGLLQVVTFGRQEGQGLAQRVQNQCRRLAGLGFFRAVPFAPEIGFQRFQAVQQGGQLPDFRRRGLPGGRSTKVP